MNEINLTRKIINVIKREFPDAYVQRVSDRFLSGIPDIRVIRFGFSGDMEIKIGKGKTSPIQDKILGRIAGAGGMVAVVRSVEEARDFMEKLSYRAMPEEGFFRCYVCLKVKDENFIGKTYSDKKVMCERCLERGE